MPQIFELSPSQEERLRDAGVSEVVIRRMQEIHRAQRSDVLGTPRP